MLPDIVEPIPTDRDYTPVAVSEYVAVLKEENRPELHIFPLSSIGHGVSLEKAKASIRIGFEVLFPCSKGRCVVDTTWMPNLISAVFSNDGRTLFYWLNDNADRVNPSYYIVRVRSREDALFTYWSIKRFQVDFAEVVHLRRDLATRQMAETQMAERFHISDDFHHNRYIPSRSVRLSNSAIQYGIPHAQNPLDPIKLYWNGHLMVRTSILDATPSAQRLFYAEFNEAAGTVRLTRSDLICWQTIEGIKMFNYESIWFTEGNGLGPERHCQDTMMKRCGISSNGSSFISIKASHIRVLDFIAGFTQKVCVIDNGEAEPFLTFLESNDGSTIIAANLRQRRQLLVLRGWQTLEERCERLSWDLLSSTHHRWLIKTTMERLPHQMRFNGIQQFLTICCVSEEMLLDCGDNSGRLQSLLHDMLDENSADEEIRHFRSITCETYDIWRDL